MARNDTTKTQMDKVLAAVAAAVSKRAKKYRQPVIVAGNNGIKKIYPYKKTDKKK